MTSSTLIGHSLNGKSVDLLVNRFIETRGLIQANSGAGKSYTIRRIAEQSFPHVQQMIMDVEGEFATLREKFPYVIAGKGGDCPADIRSAQLLARRLLELNTSAVIDISELKAHDRVLFIRRYFESLLSAPRDLWHPVLVILDEAHMFCPQTGSTESSAAVIDLMTRGRKRGFAGLLATQRISKLHKDAAAEANNKFIGRSALDVDMKRAADELGFSQKEDVLSLRKLENGQFYCFGPAFDLQGVSLVNVARCETSHPKIGQRAAAPPPAPEKVRQVLAQLIDLPHEAEQEAKTLAELKAENTGLRARLNQAESDDACDGTCEMLEKKANRLERELESEKKHSAALSDNCQAMYQQRNKIEEEWQKFRDSVVGQLDQAVGFLKSLKSGMPPTPLVPVAPVVPQRPVAVKPAPEPGRRLPDKRYVPDKQTVGWMKVIKGEPTELSAGERKILTVLAQYPHGKDTTPLAHLAGYTVNGHFKNMVGALRSNGYMTQGWPAKITDAGLEALGEEWEPLPTGEELKAYWLGKLSEGEARILGFLMETYPESTFQADLAAAAGYTVNGHFKNMLGHLRTMELVEGRGEVRASATLCESELSLRKGI